jgi:hypothetical protein
MVFESGVRVFLTLRGALVVDQINVGGSSSLAPPHTLLALAPLALVGAETPPPALLACAPYVCMPVCMRVWVCERVHTCAYIATVPLACMFMRVCVCVQMSAYMCLCMCMDIYIS